MPEQFYILLLLKIFHFRGFTLALRYLGCGEEMQSDQDLKVCSCSLPDCTCPLPVLTRAV